jgi:hypothetical protein
MKKLLIILLFTIASNAQKFGELKYNAINISVDPGALLTDEVFVIAGEFERVENAVYVKAGIELATLEGGYGFLYAATGLNFKYGHFDKYRYYVGFKMGFVRRGGYPYANLGPEAGINYTFNNNTTIGLRADYIRRDDFMYWGGDPAFRLSGYLVVIIKL